MGEVVDIRPAYEIGSDSPFPIAIITIEEIDSTGKPRTRWNFRELRTGSELQIGQVVPIEKPADETPKE